MRINLAGVCGMAPVLKGRQPTRQGTPGSIAAVAPPPVAPGTRPAGARRDGAAAADRSRSRPRDGNGKSAPRPSSDRPRGRGAESPRRHIGRAARQIAALPPDEARQSELIKADQRVHGAARRKRRALISPPRSPPRPREKRSAAARRRPHRRSAASRHAGPCRRVPARAPRNPPICPGAAARSAFSICVMSRAAP